MRAARVLIIILLVLPATRLAGQDSSAARLERARALYERLEVERAVALLRGLVSPSWPYPIAASQRALAYTYLGAATALAGRTDSAVALFRDALTLDPFTDLDPQVFTPVQVGALARARGQVFAVAVRPMAAHRVDPRTERVRFTFVTTQAASLHAQLRRGDSAFTIFEAGAGGLGEIVWDGLGPDGRLAPPGRYELRIVAASRVESRTDSARAFFDLGYDRPALEDTLPDLGPAALLPEQIAGRVALGEIGKGLAVGGGAVVVSLLVTNGDLGRDAAERPAVVAGAALIAGVVAFIERNRNRTIPANVTENNRRRDARHATNAAIGARNAARIAATILTIAPAAGVGN